MAAVKRVGKPGQPVLSKINRERRLFVIDCGTGFTCLGFDVCERWTTGIEEFLKQHGQPMPDGKPRKGTRAAYERYEQACAAGAALCQEFSLRCNIELTPQLVGLEGRRVEIIDRHGETRRFKVGKSTGWMPCHLELANSRSTGGGAVTGAPFQSVRVVG